MSNPSNPKQAKRKPAATQTYRREDITQVVRSQGNATEAHRRYHKDSQRNCQHTPVTGFEAGHDHAGQNPVKQSGRGRVATRKAIAVPLPERTAREWTWPLREKLDSFV